MRPQRQILLLAVLISPLQAFAHGEQLLIPIFFEILGLILGIVILSSLNLNVKGKLILTATYLLATFLALIVLNIIGYLTFLEYLLVTNIGLIAIPWLITYWVYSQLKDKFKKQA